MVRGDAGLDRGPEGYRVALVRSRLEDGGGERILRYAYDGDGRIVRERYEDTDGGVLETILHEYDGERLLRRIEDDDHVSVYAYDEAGRVRRVESDDGDFFERRDYRYDATGRLSAMTLAERYRGAGAFAGDENVSTSDFAFAYRDGRLDGVTESFEDDDLRLVTRYEHDGRGLLTSVTSLVDGALSDRASVLTLIRDDRGRLIGVDESDTDGDETDVAFGYADDRLVSVETRRRTGVADGNFTRTVRFEHSGLGLVERAVTTVVDDDVGTVTESTETFEYEDEPCVGRASSRPELILLAELNGVSRPASAALDCGYWLD